MRCREQKVGSNGCFEIEHQLHFNRNTRNLKKALAEVELLANKYGNVQKTC